MPYADPAKRKAYHALYSKSWAEKHPERIVAAHAKFRGTQYGKYMAQLYKAAERGIDWLFTFETWLEFWGEDISKRGRLEYNGLVMCRKGDIGPYSPANCYKASVADNVRDARIWRK